MISVSLEYLERCAADTGFEIGPLEKVIRLGELASHIARHSILKESLVLKGGSALNLCFGPPKRLSVDLDFNYVGHAERERMLEDRPRIEEAVAEISRRLGYRVQSSAEAFAGRKLFLLFRSVLGQNERIEIDLNYVFRVPFAGIEELQLWQPGELEKPYARVAGLVELLIGKMLAMLDRGAVRDVWDVANLSKQALNVMKERSFRAQFIALSAVLGHPLSTYHRERLERRIGDRIIKEELLPLLIGNPSLNANELVQKAWAVVGPFTELTRAEKEYLDKIHEGVLNPEIIFPNAPEKSAKFAVHPAILWKVSNVRSYLRDEKKSSRG
ncbi:MAG: nucleotidyl transferase AbiEii/AbiGii toxin family protein [Candidatus Aminicenantes bacterium]|nr:nucleotidyl transferase AbiEii/AbiGii toxin family protein [Candidatus Aminicenantes bacterium]